MRGYVGRKNLRPWRAAGVVLAVSGAVVAGVVSVPGQAANAAAGTPDLTAAVQYLVTSTNNVDNGPTLANDGYYDLYPGWADWGMTIDGAFALAATRGDDTVLKKVVTVFDTVGKDANGNTIDNWTGIGTDYLISGAVGKEALLAEVVGYDPHDFGGHNLISTLDGAVCTGADTNAGCAAAGDYIYASSTFDQTLAIMAQLRVGDSANAAAPIGYLESFQNANGSWPSMVPAPGITTDSDVDSTAMAVMALALVSGDTASSDVSKGISWIAAQQEADGGFPGAAGDSTNSTGLAIQALTLNKSAYSSKIASALAFLASQQNSDGGFNIAAAGQTGSDVRASVQVVGGAVGTSFGTLSDNLTGGGTTTTTTPPTTTTTTTEPTTSTSPTTTETGTSTTASTTPTSTSVPVSIVDNNGPTGGSPSSLAWTGLNAIPLVVTGFVLVAAGVLLLLWRRRRIAGRRS